MKIIQIYIIQIQIIDLEENMEDLLIIMIIMKMKIYHLKMKMNQLIILLKNMNKIKLLSYLK